MGLEQRINQQLNKYPGIKKGIKRVYQRAMYAISPKIKSEGDIERISPDDPKHEYFFGYYDKSPEDETGRYVYRPGSRDSSLLLSLFVRPVSDQTFGGTQDRLGTYGKEPVAQESRGYQKES